MQLGPGVAAVSPHPVRSVPPPSLWVPGSPRGSSLGPAPPAHARRDPRGSRESAAVNSAQDGGGPGGGGGGAVSTGRAGRARSAAAPSRSGARPGRRSLLLVSAAASPSAAVWGTPWWLSLSPTCPGRERRRCPARCPAERTAASVRPGRYRARAPRTGRCRALQPAILVVCPVQGMGCARLGRSRE